MFNVTFQLYYSSNSSRNGILVYQRTSSNQKQSDLKPDDLDDKGRAKTEWLDHWHEQDIHVFCHTDGVNQGTPAYFGKVQLLRGASYELRIQSGGPRWLG